MVSKYIDAEHFKQDLRKVSEHSEHEIIKAIEVFCALIDEAPAEDAEAVIHGHWILDEDTKDNFYQFYKCSVCGREFVLDRFDNEPEIELPYCNCGAKMDEEVQDETINK